MEEKDIAIILSEKYINIFQVQLHYIIIFLRC